MPINNNSNNKKGYFLKQSDDKIPTKLVRYIQNKNTKGLYYYIHYPRSPLSSLMVVPKGRKQSEFQLDGGQEDNFQNKSFESLLGMSIVFKPVGWGDEFVLESSYNDGSAIQIYSGSKDDPNPVSIYILINTGNDSYLVELPNLPSNPTLILDFGYLGDESFPILTFRVVNQNGYLFDFNVMQDTLGEKKALFKENTNLYGNMFDNIGSEVKTAFTSIDLLRIINDAFAVEFYSSFSTAYTNIKYIEDVIVTYDFTTKEQIFCGTKLDQALGSYQYQGTSVELNAMTILSNNGIIGASKIVGVNFVGVEVDLSGSIDATGGINMTGENTFKIYASASKKTGVIVTYEIRYQK